MVTTMDDVNKSIADLNDLVRGATLDSKKAVEELTKRADAADKRLVALDQFEKDLKAFGENLQKFSREMVDRIGGASDVTYRGAFPNRKAARSFGLAVFGVCVGKEWARKLAEDENIDLKAMTEGVDTAGGFLSPEQAEASIIRLVEAYGVFRRNAMLMPMSRDTLTVPKRTGGLTVYCPGESAAITASDIAMTQVGLVAKKWATITAVSNELMEDAVVAIAELIAQEIALAFAIKEDLCGFIGDSSATYFHLVGVLKHAGTTNLACDSTDTTFAKSCAWKYLSGVIGNVPTWALPTARYYFHRSNFWQNVVGLVDATGNPIVRFGATIQPGGAPLQLGQATPLVLGFPVELTEALPAASATAVSTANWCFGSLRMGWFLGQRKGVEIAQDKSVYFASDQTAIRGLQRIDIKAAEATAMCKVTTAAN